MRRISRRAALGAMGTVSLGALLAACRSDGSTGAVTSTTVPTSDGSSATVSPQTEDGSGLAAMFDDGATCTLAPEQTEGPFYFDVESIRTDITEERAGTPLLLGVRVQDAAACTPIGDAVVDVWHCDAGGLYSGFETASLGGGGQTDDDTYLRGAQVTDADGIARFRTVYPGWYSGRTAHIHAKVHLDRSTLLTTQFYFDDVVTDEVYASVPYVDRGPRDTTNDVDGIFDAATMLTLVPDDPGFVGLITIGVRA